MLWSIFYAGRKRELRYLIDIAVSMWPRSEGVTKAHKVGGLNAAFESYVKERDNDEGATEPVITLTLYAYGIPDTAG